MHTGPISPNVTHCTLHIQLGPDKTTPISNKFSIRNAVKIKLLRIGHGFSEIIIYIRLQCNCTCKNFKDEVCEMILGLTVCRKYSF